MEKNKNKQRLITTNERIEEMMMELMERNGYNSISECVRTGIVLLHNKTFPSYVKEMKQPQTPEDREKKRIERLEAEKRARWQIEVDRGREICEKLGGKVIETGRDMYACVYDEYAYLNKFQVDVKPQQVPLENLSEEHIINQYRYANKETILDIINNPSS